MDTGEKSNSAQAVVSRRRAVNLVASTAALPFIVGGARSQALPASLRIVVPFPPGGPTDAVARFIAEGLKQRLTRTVVVENKPGAGGTIGVRHALTAPADGATWLIGNNQTHATVAYLIKDAGYDPLVDFAAVCSLADMHHVLVTRTDLGAATVAEFLQAAKSTSGKLNFGSTGVGSGSHLAMELFMARAGVMLQHVPFQGAAQMAGEIAARRLDCALAILPSVSAAIASGQMRALAVAGSQRAPQLPTVATLAEGGVAGVEADSWLGLFAASKVPPDATRAMESLVAEILTDRDMRARIEALGLSVRWRPAVEFQDFQRREIARWGEVITATGLKPE